MRGFIRLLSGAAVAAVLSGAAFAAVDVTFVEPEHYRDLKRSDSLTTQRERERIMDRLRAHIEKLGAKYLAEGETLEIEVLDIDLAGRYEPFLHGSQDGRVATRVDWPSMQLRYVLTDGGRDVLSGEERIADLAYLDHVGSRSSSDSLRYEKAMLDVWFRDRIADRKPPRD